MKKLKTWQIVLLVIFYPVGLVYLIVWLCKRNKQPAAVPSAAPAVSQEIIKEMYSNVVATTYPNADGTSRQYFIAKLNPGEELTLRKAPTDEYPDSIGVFTSRNEQIGVLSFQIINELFGLYAHNELSVYVSEILHSERGLGVSMLIKVHK